MYNSLRCEPDDDRSRIPERDEFRKQAGEMMSNALRAILVAALLAIICCASLAQNKSSATGKAAAKKGKTSSESCDGALDIVPVKAVTFVRKRRPASSDPLKPAGANPEKRQ
jgi:hypothetical protein